MLDISPSSSSGSIDVRESSLPCVGRNDLSLRVCASLLMLFIMSFLMLLQRLNVHFASKGALWRNLDRRHGGASGLRIPSPDGLVFATGYEPSPIRRKRQAFH